MSKAQSVELEQMKRWRRHCLSLVVSATLGLCVLSGGASCAKPRAAGLPPPPPEPSAEAIAEMDEVGPALETFLGQVLRYFEGIDEMRR